MSKSTTVSFNLNGKKVTATVPSHFTVLRMIRETFRLTGTKWSCEMGECGVCTMLVDGEPVTTCLMMACQVEGRRVDTIEGLSETPLGQIVTRALLEAGAVQCGYCTPGMAVASIALLTKNQNPTAHEAQVALSGVLCRCTGYQKIVDAVLLAARYLKKEKKSQKEVTK
jgi:carbon-monoxide dehydrogenase small subunit